MAAFNIVMAGLVPAISGQFRHAGDGGKASFFRAPGITDAGDPLGIVESI